MLRGVSGGSEGRVVGRVLWSVSKYVSGSVCGLVLGGEQAGRGSGGGGGEVRVGGCHAEKSPAYSQERWRVFFVFVLIEKSPAYIAGEMTFPPPFFVFFCFFVCFLFLPRRARRTARER